MTIAVLMGGPSPEAEVSRKTAATVGKALTELGLAYELVELDGTWMQRLSQMQPTFVYLALHGCPGEDGTVQGALELMGLPYQGSGVLASALAMDKGKSKACWQAAGIPTPQGQAVTSVQTVPDVPLPVVVKPVQGGSTLGMSIVREQAALAGAIQNALQYDEQALVEMYISGPEYTVGLLDGKAIGAMRIEPQAECYDYAQKYAADSQCVYTPLTAAEPMYAPLTALAEQANAAVGATGCSRVDILYDTAHGQFQVLEVNTLPGLNVLYPRMLAAAGMSLAEVIGQQINAKKKRQAA